MRTFKYLTEIGS